MAFNELEAMKMIDDGKLTDNEIKLLTRLRDGLVPPHKGDEIDEKALEELEKKGLVQRTALSTPRAATQVEALIASEAGTTVLNLFDKRWRENANGDRDALTAPDVDPEVVKAPTDEQKRQVPSIEAEPFEADKKNLGQAPANMDEAMKDPLVAAGARDPSQAETKTEKELKDAKVVIDKDTTVGGASFDHDADGKVGGSAKKSK